MVTAKAFVVTLRLLPSVRHLSRTVTSAVQTAIDLSTGISVAGPSSSDPERIVPCFVVALCFAVPNSIGPELIPSRFAFVLRLAVACLEPAACPCSHLLGLTGISPVVAGLAFVVGLCLVAVDPAVDPALLILLLC